MSDRSQQQRQQQHHQHQQGGDAESRKRPRQQQHHQHQHQHQHHNQNHLVQHSVDVPRPHQVPRHHSGYPTDVHAHGNWQRGGAYNNNNNGEANIKYFPHGSAHHGHVSSTSAPRVQVSQPTEIACMSRVEDRSWVPGSRVGLPAYNSAPLPSDLNVGCESFFKQYIAEGPESLTHVLRCVQGKYGVVGAAAAPDFVTWRGQLTKIMCHPFSPREALVFGVWRHKQTIYISARETDEKQRRDQNMDDRGKRFMYYGYKFEECSTREMKETDGETNGSVDTNVTKPVAVAGEMHTPVNTNLCFGSVFKTRIGNHRVVACGEVDCFDPSCGADVSEDKSKCKNDSYLELKVTKQQTTERDVNSFERFKLLKWYCQSFIAGVPRIIAGFRDDQGFLHSTQTFNTTEIPTMLKVKYSPRPPPWDHRRLVSFLDQVLSWLRAEVVEQDVMYELSYDGRKGSALQLAPSQRQAGEEISPELYL